jgi:pimeloyl-ACP methyl ester carboxylesterase
MPAPRHKTVDSLGLPIHFLEWGEPDGNPLILVHGFLDLAFSWTTFVAELYRRAARPLWIIAPDCRGHGDSGWVSAGGYYHFPDYVLDLDCVIQSLHVKSIRLIGHSMGGTISLLYTGAFPECVTQLALIEGVGPIGMNFAEAPLRMEQWLGEIRQRGRNHFRKYSSVEAGARQLRQTNPRLQESFARSLAQAAMKQSADGQWIWKFDPLHRTTSPQPFYSAQAVAFLRRIACPVLIVDGAQSRQTKRTDKQERYDAIADCRQIVIDGAGHMVHQDNPAALVTALLPFLQ